jgi:hypothetical protein
MQLRSAAASLYFAALLCAHATSQTPASSSARIRSLLTKSPTDRLVAQLVENAATFRATLPSLVAHETIESSASEGWIFRNHAKAEAIMRVMRKTPDGPLEESREITAVNGKPLAPGKRADLPTMLSGGFGNIAGFFFNQRQSACFSYTLIPKDIPDGTLRLHIAVSPESLSLPNCPSWARRIDGTAIVTSDSRQLMHLEFNIPVEDAKPNRWPFSSVDLSPIRIGETTFWLPTTVIGRSINGKELAEWVSHFSDYHRFAATATILPATP